MIIGAPYSVTEDILTKEYQVHIVGHSNTHTELDLDGKDPYKVKRLTSIHTYIYFLFKKKSINTHSIIHSHLFIFSKYTFLVGKRTWIIQSN